MPNHKQLVLVTGAYGFIGKNLCAALAQSNDIEIVKYGRENTDEDLQAYVKEASFIFHLAGTNRPRNDDEFHIDNTELTKRIVSLLEKKKEPTPILLSSSIQAAIDNPYGTSKKAAEDAVATWARDTKNEVYLYRLPNVFGKWAKPNYNSVVATFCHNLVRGIPLQVHEPDRVLELVHIDDVVRCFIDCLKQVQPSKERFCDVKPVYKITVGKLSETLKSFWGSRESQVLPDLSDQFHKALYGTFTSYYQMNDLSIKPARFSDERGWLFELMKSKYDGQIFVSSTKPGYTRGDHWHHTKVEKFVVIKGSGKLLFRQVSSDEIIRYELSDKQIEIVDIPVGYIHAIHNDGDEDMLLLVWASEMLDKQSPDTYYEKVKS